MVHTHLHARRRAYCLYLPLFILAAALAAPNLMPVNGAGLVGLVLMVVVVATLLIDTENPLNDEVPA